MFFSLLMKNFCLNLIYLHHLRIMQKSLVPLEYVCCLNLNWGLLLSRCPCYLQQTHNRFIRELFQTDISTLPYVISYWNRFVDDIVWKKAWLLPNRYLVTNKVKEISFKLIHKFYLTKTYIKKDLKKKLMLMKKLFNVFWHCPVVKISGRTCVILSLLILIPILFYIGRMYCLVSWKIIMHKNNPPPHTHIHNQFYYHCGYISYP